MKRLKEVKRLKYIIYLDFDSSNRCFICNLTRTVFEKEGISFDNHISNQHKIWSYVAYLIYLRTSDQSDHTGTESYVMTKVKRGDISWLPI
jgi:hypothetical protein